MLFLISTRNVIRHTTNILTSKNATCDLDVVFCQPIITSHRSNINAWLGEGVDIVWKVEGVTKAFGGGIFIETDDLKNMVVSSIIYVPSINQDFAVLKIPPYDVVHRSKASYTYISGDSNVVGNFTLSISNLAFNDSNIYILLYGGVTKSIVLSVICK